ESFDHTRSKESMITIWHGYKWLLKVETHSFPTLTSYTLDFYVRLDLAFLIKNTRSLQDIVITKHSTLTETYEFQDPWDQTYGDNYRVTANGTVPMRDAHSIYNTGFNCEASFSTTTKRFNFSISNIKGFYQIATGSKKNDSIDYYIDDFSTDLQLDSKYNILIQSYDSSSGEVSPLYRYSIKINGSYFFPPSKNIFALETKPVLLLPISGSLFSYRDGITLIWDSLPLMTLYRLQVAADSLFAKSVVDTTVTSSTFSPPSLKGLSNYFWRVVGINSEGESRWSDVWNFTTGLTSEVRAENKFPLTLSPYPNPASMELTIPYTLPEQGNARLLLYNLEGRIIRESRIDSDTYELKWDISDLPTGSYVLVLMAEKETKTQIVKIMH
ncbi:MAG: T9SS type A sorting domain-containing protein, partial [Ignavibacteriota bacterium]